MRMFFIAIATLSVTFSAALTNPYVAFSNAAVSNATLQDDAVQQLPSQKLEIDNDHSSVVFAVSHYGLSYVYGRFNKCKGSIELNQKTPEQSVFEFEIDPASVDTNNLKRDEHLRSEEFFDVEQYDSISFNSTSIQLIEETSEVTNATRRTYMISGNLTMHGEMRKVVIPMELISSGKGHDGKDRFGFMSKFVIQRSNHGMDAMANVVGDKVAVTFCFQAVVADEKETLKERTQRIFDAKLLPDTQDAETEPDNTEELSNEN